MVSISVLEQHPGTMMSTKNFNNNYGYLNKKDLMMYQVFFVNNLFFDKIVIFNDKLAFFQHENLLFNNVELKLNYPTIFYFIFSITFAAQTFKIKIIMRNVKNVILVSFVLFATFLSSCDKEVDSTALTIDQTQKGTIKGYVYANTDLSTYGTENAPAGTVVNITLDYSEIEGLESTDGVLSDTAIVGSDGTFTYEVPTDANGVNVYVSISFSYDQVQSDVIDKITVKKSFSTNAMFSNVLPNQTQSRSIFVSEGDQLTDAYGTVTISGTIAANYDLTASDETVPSGTIITFHTDNTGGFSSWSNKVTVGTNGAYSVTVPLFESIYIDYDFTVLTGKNGSGITTAYRFQVTNNSIGSFSIDNTIQDIDLGDGDAQ
jgi:hypothetical protein